MKKRYVMIGAPVSSVRTPPLLRSFLAQRGIDAEIDVIHIGAGDLDGFMGNVKRDTTVDGLLVTMPHKKTIIPYLHATSSAARSVMSVNVVKRLASGALAGAQFDGVALVEALRAKEVAVDCARVLLAGVGGAGLAIAQAILAHGCQRLVLCDTNGDILIAALHMLRRQSRCPVSKMAAPSGQDHDLLINATPLGMGDDDPSPFDAEMVARARWVADIVADPPATRLAALAKSHRLTLITGRDMVRAQIDPIGRWLLNLDVEQ
jgi:shikimate dehydrogenase